MNKTFNWVIEHMPPPKYEGRFYSYSYVFKEAYGFEDKKKAGRQIREDLQDYIYDLCRNYQCAVQIGVKVQNYRGIRIFNLK